jgi:hypothetical protein
MLSEREVGGKRKTRNERQDRWMTMTITMTMTMTITMTMTMSLEDGEGENYFHSYLAGRKAGIY